LPVRNKEGFWAFQDWNQILKEKEGEKRPKTFSENISRRKQNKIHKKI
jgi:hypothetical protein